MNSIPIAADKRKGPGRPSTKSPTTVSLRYTAIERALAIEYVVNCAGDVVSAQLALAEDPDWTRPDVPAVDTIKTWCKVNREAKLYIDQYYAYGIRDQLIDTASKILKAIERELIHADKPSESKDAAGYAERVAKLSTAAGVNLSKWNLLVNGSENGTPQSGRLLIPRIGDRQNVDGNETAQPELSGGLNINLFSRREVVALVGDLSKMSTSQMLKAVLNEDEGNEDSSAPTAGDRFGSGEHGASQIIDQ